MCLIVCSFDPPTEHSFIMLANRDEFYDRSTRQMSWWKDDLKILAGKDLEAGGTWLAISKDGNTMYTANLGRWHITKIDISSLYS